MRAGLEPSPSPSLTAERAVDDRGRRTVLRGALGLTARLNAAIRRGHEFTANSEVITLVALRTSGPLRARDITSRTGMTRAGTTNLIDRLERAVLVARTPADDDQRGVVVELTPGGAVAVDAMADRIAAVLADTTPELASWVAVFDALGIEVGTVRLPEGSTRARLEYLRAAATIGATIVPLYAEAFGPDTAHAFLLFHLLLAADEPGGTRPTEFAAEAVLQSSSTSDLLRQAEQLGFVTRRRGLPPDRRSRVVTTTDRGRSAVAHIVDGSEPVLRAIAGGFFHTPT